MASKKNMKAPGRRRKGKERGEPVRPETPPGDHFSLETPSVRDAGPAASDAKVKLRPTARKRGIAAGEPQLISYRHDNRRKNNPEVGMVDPDSDPDEGKTRYAYDPHLDPPYGIKYGRNLQPFVYPVREP